MSATFRKVFMVGTMPENNYEDSEVLTIKEGQTDDEAFAQAIAAYGDDEEFYIDTEADCKG